MTGILYTTYNKYKISYKRLFGCCFLEYDSRSFNWKYIIFIWFLSDLENNASLSLSFSFLPLGYFLGSLG